MTVLASDATSQYTGTGFRVFFEYGFPVIQGEFVVYVLVDGQVVPFEYQETGIVFDTPPALGALILMWRWTDVNQLSDFQPFESFPAEKTEDAVDKLIMLKQEGIFRGGMNLVAVPFLSEVEIVNDKGENAHILIWNEHIIGSAIINDAGVFAGEVTQNMPEAGAVVEKPDDFAYFQYGMANREVFLTSRPYPIELIEGYSSFVTPLKGRTVEMAVEGYEATAVPLGGSLRLAINSFVYEPEGYLATATPLSGVLRAAIESFTYETEGYLATSIPVSGNLRIALVSHPYETEGYLATATPIGGNLT